MPRAVARELTGTGVDRHAPVRPELIEDGPAMLHGHVWLASASRTVAMCVARPAAATASLRARWSLPRSDMSSIAWRLPEAHKAANLVAAFSLLKEPAPKSEFTEGHRPWVCSISRGCVATLLGAGVLRTPYRRSEATSPNSDRGYKAAPAHSGLEQALD